MAASFTFLRGFLPGCQVGGQIEGDRGPGRAGSALDAAGKEAADGARGVQSLWCSISDRDISKQRPLPTEPPVCSVAAFHTVHLTFFSWSFFLTRLPATVGKDFCLIHCLFP